MTTSSGEHRASHDSHDFHDTRPAPDANAPLVALGWDDALDAAFRAHAPDEHHSHVVPARVVAHHRDRWLLDDGVTVREATLAGRLRHHRPHDVPTVGDWVVADRADDGAATAIRALLPRRTLLQRKSAGDASEAQPLAANVDLVLIAAALPDDVNVRRINRYLTIAWDAGAQPLVVLTKADLAPDVGSAIARVRGEAPGVDVLALSSARDDGLDALRRHLHPGITAVVVGPSGAGKSTLVNRLLGAERLRTGEVRQDGAGRHTTTHRELVRLPGGAMLIDTPGIRELQLWADDDGLERTFADVDALTAECRFGDCRHEQEPGCAVTAAVAEGTLPADRLAQWNEIQRELAWLARRRDAAATAAERARIKKIHVAMRDHLTEKNR